MTHKTITASAARADFGDLVNQVHYGGEEVVITRRGRPLVAVISMEAYLWFAQLVKAAEDEIDARAILGERE